MSRGRMLIIAFCAALALAVAGCGSDDDSSTTAASTEASTAKSDAASEVSADLNEKPKVVPPTGPAPKQLEEIEIVEGTGAEAKAGDEVSVQYVGVGYKSGTEFDSSWSRNEPFSFTLGAGEVIAGWDQGVEGMRVGGRRELVIPPDLAYGPQGNEAIAPNATLVFVIDLLAVK